MPHAEIKYSDDLNIDAVGLLKEIEAVILEHDPGAGDCKGRAFPIKDWHHTHVLLEVAMLTKPHRDDAFSQTMIKAFERVLHAHLSQKTYVSISLTYMGDTYFTGVFDPTS